MHECASDEIAGIRGRGYTDFRESPKGELRRIRSLRLSEKVHEQRSGRGFGRYTEREKGLRVVCSATLQAPLTLFGQSLEEEFSEVQIQDPA